MGNPLNAFLLIKRLTTDWKIVKELINNKKGLNVTSQLKSKTKQLALLWPTNKDLTGAVMTLTRLQETYLLSTNDMANGKLGGKAFNTRLSADDCFEVGKQSYRKGNSHHALQWLKQALEQLKNEGSNPTVDKEKISNYLSTSSQNVTDLEMVRNHPDKLYDEVLYEACPS